MNPWHRFRQCSRHTDWTGLVVPLRRPETMGFDRFRPFQGYLDEVFRFRLWLVCRVAQDNAYQCDMHPDGAGNRTREGAC